MISRAAFFLLILTIGAMSNHDAQANVMAKHDCGNPKAPWLYATITGTITKSDAQNLVDYVQALRRSKGFDPTDPLQLLGPACNTTLGKLRVSVHLNSTGGDLNAAIQIGNLLKSAGEYGSASVGNGAICMSSCVLILAAAKRRHVSPSAEVGIHRPYLERAEGMTYQQASAIYERLTEDLNSFLRGTGIDQQLAADMMKTPPERIRRLTRQELFTYGLSETDIALQESDAMTEAAELGVSRAELARRKAKAERLCGANHCQAHPLREEACLQYVMCIQQATRQAH